MPRSVAKASISVAGVTSKAGLYTSTPGGAQRTPPKPPTSDASLNSIGMFRPAGVLGSKVLRGAATRKGTPCRAATDASPYVPTLLAVSPLAAIRSAPVMTAPTWPDANSDATAVSGSSVVGMPSRVSSQVVRRAPWSNGRVSVT